MKHFFKMLAITLLLAGQTHAQTDPVRTELDQIFYYVDKSQVPTGYLDEYGPQFAVKKWYTGVLADSNTIESLTAFRFLYNDIEQARIYSAAPTLTSLNTVNTTISQQATTSSTPLIFLSAKYATLKEDAINLNLFSKYGANQIKDVPGRTQSPYNAATNFFAACPLTTDAPQENIISLKYIPSLAYTNCGKIISSVAVNFLQGAGYKTIAANATVNKIYTDSSGYKKFVAFLRNRGYMPKCRPAALIIWWPLTHPPIMLALKAQPMQNEPPLTRQKSESWNYTTKWACCAKNNSLARATPK